MLEGATGGLETRMLSRQRVADSGWPHGYYEPRKPGALAAAVSEDWQNQVVYLTSRPIAAWRQV